MESVETHDRMRAFSQGLLRALRILVILFIALLSLAMLAWVLLPGNVQPISSATHFARLIKIPEPPPWAMIAMGAVVLIGIQQLRRRRKRA